MESTRSGLQLRLLLALFSLLALVSPGRSRADDEGPRPMAVQDGHSDHGHGEPGHDHPEPPRPPNPGGILGKSAITWETSLERAISAGRKSGRLVMVDFEAEWCGWCKKLDRETYAEESVIRFVSEYLVAVKVDTDEEPGAKERFGVEGLPTILFLEVSREPRRASGVGDSGAGTSPADSSPSAGEVREVGRIVGFRPAGDFLAEAGKLVQAGKALAELREEASVNPDDPVAQRAYARALGIGGKIEEAERVLRAALERREGDAGLTVDLAGILRQGDHHEEAAGMYRRVLADPTATVFHEESYLPLASSLVTLKRYAEAEKALGPFLRGVGEAVGETPEEPEPAEDPAAAADSARRLDLARIEALFLRAYTRAVQGRPADALEDLRIALKADPLGPWGMQAGFIINRLER